MYAKVFRALWDGSLCGQSDAQLVFIYLLAHADVDGCACQPRAAVAAKTGLAVERVVAALSVLEAADPASGSEAEDGRRLVRNNPHRDEWQIVNYLKYRGIRDEEERRRQNREAQQRHRQPRSAAVSQGQPPSSQGEVEVEGEGEESKHLSADADVRVPAKASKPRREPEPPGFAEFYAAYPRRDGRRAAALEFARVLSRHPTYTASNLREGAEQFAARVEQEATEKRFVPMPKVWLHQDRFREYFDEDNDAEDQETAEDS